MTETKAKKPAAKAAAKTGGKITVQQIGSPIGRTPDQAATLKGLGLGKMNRKSTLEDTSSVRGMINAVRHLVKIVDDKVA